MTINTNTLDRLVETFPLGSEVDNVLLGNHFRGVVVGYHYTSIGYDGLLIVSDKNGQKWCADPDLCEKVA